MDKKVSSLDQFLSHMNKKVIFDSFPGIGNVVVSYVVPAVSYLHSRDITHAFMGSCPTISHEF